MARSRDITTNRWLVAAATAAGAKHIRNSSPNQDCFRHLTADDDQLIIAVCDGAGSTTMGGAGAQIAATAAVESIQHQLEMRTNFSLPDILRKAFNHARASVIQIAETSDYDVRDYATTITLFVHSGGISAAAQLGDGACVLGTPDGWTLTAEPQRGQHANETFFITQHRAEERLTISPEISKVQHVMLCTDGMMSLTLQQPGNVPHQPYFEGTFSWLRSCQDPHKASRQMDALLRSDKVRSLVDDDLTMVQATLMDTPTGTETQHAKW